LIDVLCAAVIRYKRIVRAACVHQVLQCVVNFRWELCHGFMDFLMPATQGGRGFTSYQDDV